MLRNLSRLLLCICILALPAGAATLNVGPGQPYTTIQSAIAAAAPGDTVLVAPGTYYENIDFLGKAITVTSSAGPATTIIDGAQGIGLPTVNFHSSETRTSVLSALTIQHGGGTPPGTYQGHGGINISAGAPTILDNVITANYCAGISSLESAPLIQGNEISATFEISPTAGGCFSGDGTGIFVESGLVGTYAADHQYASATIIGNTIENNVSSATDPSNGGLGGAGIYITSEGSTIIENNLIRNNLTKYGVGGGIYTIGNGSAYIVQNQIYGNQAGCGGGAFAFEGGGLGSTFYALVANNTVFNNTSKVISGSTNCEHIAQIYPGPSLDGLSGPGLAFINNIISGSSTDPSIECTSYFAPPTEAAQPLFDHNVLYNAAGPFFGPHCVDVSALHGNIIADPLFVDAAHNNFHLNPASPAIDHANNSALQLIQQFTGSQLNADLDGKARVQDFTGLGYPVVDAGVFEYPGRFSASPTTVVLTSSSYYGNAGSNYLLTATFASALGTPVGNATFFLDGKQIGTSTIGPSGIATLTNFPLSPGVHSFYVTYPGEAQFSPAMSVVIIVRINSYYTSLSLSSSSNPSSVGQPVVFTVIASTADRGFVASPVTLYDNSTGITLASLTPNPQGIATFSTSSLAIGTHALSATYAGDATHTSAQAVLTQTVINGSATTTNLNCTPATIYTTTFALLTVSVSSPSSIPTGSIAFTDNGASLTQAPLNASGNTYYTYASQTLGAHTLMATYVPTGSFAPSTSSCSVTVSLKPDTVSVASSVNPSSVAQPVSFIAQVTYGGPPTSFTSSGSFTFSDGTNSLATVNAVFAGPYAGSATYTTSTLSAGTHTITATLNPVPGYAPASASLTQTVTGLPSTATLMVNPTTAAAGSVLALTATIASPSTSAPTPTGTVTFLNSGVVIGLPGALINGVSTIRTSALPPGTDLLSCTYSGDTNYAPSPCNTVPILITAGPTTLTLVSSANPTAALTPVTFTAHLAYAAQAAGNTIQFTFSSASRQPFLASALTDANGNATYTTSALIPGAYTVTATFAPTSSLLGSTANLLESVLPSPPQLPLPPPHLPSTSSNP